jgi:hypothetical protein
MLIDCITCLSRVQGADSMCVAIDQLSEFTHFPVISLEYGATQVTKLSCGDMFRVHEQPRVIFVIKITCFIAHVGRSCSELQAHV